MRYLALLRGINVGGHAKLSMADLRALLASQGHTEVLTYIQSGNAIFTSERDDPSELASEIESAITRELGLTVKVLLRTRDKLEAVIGGNPFVDAEVTPTRLYANFLSVQPEPERLAQIDPLQFAPDRFHVGDRVIYLWYPTGAGRTKLTNAVFERRLGVIGTARNWNTVNRLLSMISD